MPIKCPDLDQIPYAVPFEAIEALEDVNPSFNPEAVAFSSDHAGVARALHLLTPRQQEILCQKTGLNESGIPLSSAEIAEQLGLSVNTVSSTLTQARNRLRAVENIMSVINGEYNPYQDSHDNPLQTS